MDRSRDGHDRTGVFAGKDRNDSNGNYGCTVDYPSLCLFLFALSERNLSSFSGEKTEHYRNIAKKSE